MKIIGFIGEWDIKGFANEVKVKRILSRKIINDYYSLKNVYLTGLMYDGGLFVGELVSYLQLKMYCVIGREEEVETLGKLQRIRYKKLKKFCKEEIHTYSLPNYKIKNRKLERMKERFGGYYTMKQQYLKSYEFIIDSSDVVVFIWSGKKAGSYIYRAINYGKEKEAEMDVINYGNRFI